MKMSGMLTRSSMACIFSPSRCRSKASPRMACERGAVRSRLLPRSLWRQQLFHSLARRPVRPEQPGRKALT